MAAMTGVYGLDGRVAIVTGAAGGIGRAIALRLAREGCAIGIFDIDETGAAETVDLLRREGRASAAAIGSVARAVDVARGVDLLTDALGAPQILVNNAGILRTAPFVDLTESVWREVFAINVDGAFHFCKAVLPGMLARKRGAIVNMASWTAKKGVPNHAAYSASKFALVGLTQSLAGEVAADGVRVNAVCPGIIVETRMRDVVEALNAAQGLPDVETRAKSIPMRRAGTPEDVARLVAFLVSDEADYMTGQAVNVTGGLWMN